MKIFFAGFFALILGALPIVASPSGAKQLQNVKGQVHYGAQTVPTTPLAPHVVVPISDNDYAATGSDSQAAILLPDSSRVIIGANSTVRMISFTQSAIAHARFSMTVGKLRFEIQHPSGARADYRFSTPTGQIAVRGTVGDLLSNPGGMQVNVYALSNPALPVQVTLVNGQVFTLAAGQSLVVTAAAGTLTASVSALTHSLFQPFSELGAPANAGSLGIASSAASAAASTLTTVGAAAAGTAAAAVIVTSTGKTGPTPAPTSTTVPITVSGQPGRGGTPQNQPPPPSGIVMPGSQPGAPGGVGHPPIPRPTPPS
jgi:hypothetical protein